jgi:flavin-dependent dehydrogenase
MTDILVVGGGPVGLAAAIEARMAGFSAVVLEPRTAPIDKACGEGLMPGAVEALARLGVDPPGHVLRGIGYLDGSRRVDHVFRHGVGRGVRRTALHAALAARAAEAGVEFAEGRLRSLVQATDAVTVGLADGRELRARWMIGADGLHSTVREIVGLAPRPERRRRFGLRRHLAVAPWSDLVEVHWTPVAEVYVTPVGEQEVGVAVLGPQHFDYDEVVSSVPALASRVSGAAVSSELLGAGPLRQRVRGRVVGRVLLAGDASGYVDAITGEGIRIGLAEARAAIACLAAGDPDRYEREWLRATRSYRMLTTGLVRLGGSPLRPAIVPLARSLPAVYGAIVERLAG